MRTIKDLFKWVVIEKGGDPDKPELLHYPVQVASDALKQFTNALSCSFTMTWIGHSTLLIRVGNTTILTDPIWSDRASPVSWAGPKRCIPPGLLIDQLPKIDIVVLSHNHYDHLDLSTLRKLGDGPAYHVPLGVGSYLEKKGIGPCHEYDWWEESTIDSVSLTCLPAQHFSSRTLFDRDRTLWCSWAFKSPYGSLYFGGDTGYFNGFKEIGSRLGPFDVGALPIGAYLPRWFMHPVHLGPEDALKVAEDIGAGTMIPIHWGTFNLAADPHDHSPAVLANLAHEHTNIVSNVKFLQPGDTYCISEI